MDIADWRKKIDEVDRRLVELLSERARAAVEIGRLKRDTSLPIYEPERERVVFENVRGMNRGPLPGQDLVSCENSSPATSQSSLSSTPQTSPSPATPPLPPGQTSRRFAH